MANAGVPVRNVAESCRISQIDGASSGFSDWRRRLRRRRLELCSPSEIADARWGVEINFVIPAFLSTKYARGRKRKIYRRLSNVAYTRNQWKIYPAFARCRTFLSRLTSQYVTIINDSRYKAEKRRSCDSATSTA